MHPHKFTIILEKYIYEQQRSVGSETFDYLMNFIKVLLHSVTGREDFVSSVSPQQHY